MRSILWLCTLRSSPALRAAEIRFLDDFTINMFIAFELAVLFFVHTMYAMRCVVLSLSHTMIIIMKFLYYYYRFQLKLHSYNKINGFFSSLSLFYCVYLNKCKMQMECSIYYKSFCLLTASPSAQIARQRERERQKPHQNIMCESHLPSARRTSLFYVNKMHICFLNTTIISHFMTIRDIFRVEVCELQRTMEQNWNQGIAFFLCQ